MNGDVLSSLSRAKPVFIWAFTHESATASNMSPLLSAAPESDDKTSPLLQIVLADLKIRAIWAKSP